MGNTEFKSTNSGLRVIQLTPDSPAKLAGLSEFLDFILEISGHTQSLSLPASYLVPIDVPPENQQDLEHKIMMKVYNLLTRNIRTISIMVSPNAQSQNLLGMLVREEEYKNAYERVLRVAEVYPKSPAEIAGLQRNFDYIIGSPEFPFESLSDFASYVLLIQEKNSDRGFTVWVYNSECNQSRCVKIIPNKKWGGEGVLGCEFAVGIVNNLPQLEDNGNNLNTLNGSALQLVVSEGLQEEDEDKAKIYTLEGGSHIFEDDNKGLDAYKEGSFNDIGKPENAHSDTKSEPELETGTVLPEMNGSLTYTPEDDKQSTPLFKPRSIEDTDKETSNTPINSLQRNVQTQKGSVRLIPKPSLKVHHQESSQLNSLTGIPDISPIPKKNSLLAVPPQAATPKNVSQLVKRPKATSVSQTLPSQPTSPYSWSLAEKDDSHSLKHGSTQSHYGRSKRRLTDGSQKDKTNVKHEEEGIEVYFQGIERIEHEEDEPVDFPKVLTTNPQELTNLTTTLLDRSGAESQNKSLETAETYEKPICKTVIQYTFHSKKIGGDYIIKSTDLFNVGEFKKII